MNKGDELVEAFYRTSDDSDQGGVSFGAKRFWLSYAGSRDHPALSGLDIPFRRHPRHGKQRRLG